MTNFIGVHAALGSALTKRAYEELTPVQQAVLAPEMDGRDALVSAQTGSGKTVAFGIAIAPTLLGETAKFSHAEAPLALVVAPTRELALQVKRELEWLYGETGAQIVSCVGGMDMRDERRALARGAHIVVGTPGRLCDHIRRNAFDTSALAAVVLDEADEMLDLGFREDLEFILEATPEERRTLMFSATVPAQIAKLAKSYQRDAVRIETAAEQKQHADIEYRALMTAPRERENAIINVLRFYDADNAIVFCNTRATVNHMMARFSNRGFSVVALSGELSQNERTHALQALRDGRAKVCIATDVAARGIDLPKLELVIHADLPSSPDTLLHRSGRTGRAGRKGVSVLMVDHKSRKKAERVLRFAKINAKWTNPPSADEVNARDEQRILENPLLSDRVLDEEKDFIERLLAVHSPEQVAAALLRFNKASQSAPEDIEIVDISAPPPSKFERGERSERPGPRERNEFENSVWISISVGRKQRAEPRWIIPMLCKRGNLNKRAIGSIRMQPEETHIQLDAGKADTFFEAIGSNKTLEKNIRVKILDGEPGGSDAAASGKERRSKKRPKEPFGASNSERPKREIQNSEAPAKRNTSAPAKTKSHTDKGKAKKARRKAAGTYKSGSKSMGGEGGNKPVSRKPKN